MVTPELLEFIRAQHKDGISREDLEGLLVSEGGWNKEDIAEAYNTILAESSTPVPTAPVPPVAMEEKVASPAVDAPSVEVSTPPPVVATEEHAPAVEPTPVAKEETPVPQEDSKIEKVPEERKIAIEVVKEEMPAQVTPVVTEVPATTEPAAEADDFLGIFTPAESSPEPEAPVAPVVEVKEEMAKVEEVPVVEPPKQEQPAPSVATAPTPVQVPSTTQAPEIKADVVPPPASAVPTTGIIAGRDQYNHELHRPEPVATTVPPVTPSQPAVAQSPAMTTPEPVMKSMDTPPPPPPSSSPFKFDLSKIRAATAATPPSTQPVETKSAMPATPAVQAPKPEPVTPAAPVAGPQTWLTGEKKIVPPAPVPASVPKSAEIKPVAPDVAQKSSDAVGETPKKIPTMKRSMASDLLLRGMGTAVAGMPAISAPEEEKPLPEVKKAETRTPQEVAAEKAMVEELKMKNEKKRTIAITIGALVTILVLIIGAFVYFKYGGPNSSQTSATAFSRFFDSSSFSYKGKGTADLLLSTATDGVERTGIVKFSLDYGGLLKNAKEGYGDGVHRVKLSGELSSGNFLWKTSSPIETDIRVIGSSLYFRVLSFPESGDLDPELFKTYWVRVNLSEVAKELALSGVSLNQEGYGSFGGQNAETTFNALLKKNSPFSVSDTLPEEDLAGVSMYHFGMKTDPEKMLAFTSALYRKYFGKELLLTTDQRIRFLDALAKIKGEAWVDKKTGALAQISFSANFDDDMIDVRVKGPVNITFALSDFNKQVTVDAPTPILTLEELKVRMENYKKVQDVRARDKVKVDTMNKVIEALNRYKNTKGRYPVLLAELYPAGSLDTAVVSNTELNSYHYAAYLTASAPTKTNRCPAKGNLCDFFHIGVNIEDTANPLLINDTDAVTDVRGDDKKGCSGEDGYACYDLVSSGVPSSSANTAEGN